MAIKWQVCDEKQQVEELTAYWHNTARIHRLSIRALIQRYCT